MGTESKRIALIGVPMDAGASQRGCCMGPAAYRVAGLAAELAALGHAVEDRGDLVPEFADPPPDGRVTNLAAVAGWTRAIRKAVSGGFEDGRLPVLMGGDHSLAMGSVSAAAARAEAGGRPLFVLWLDAHSDINTPGSTPSGNLHGCPVAFFLGLEGFDGILGAPVSPVVAPERVCMLGIRSVDRGEHDALIARGIRVEDMRRIDEHGIERLLRPFLEDVAAAGGMLHVSLDVDFLDPGIAPAVGTTVPGGATYREAHLAMEMVHESGLVTSLDLVELNPFLDMAGRTARLMVDLTGSLFGRRVMDRETPSS
jgi:arginase